MEHEEPRTWKLKKKSDLFPSCFDEKVNYDKPLVEFQRGDGLEDVRRGDFRDKVKEVHVGTRAWTCQKTAFKKCTYLREVHLGEVWKNKL